MRNGSTVVAGTLAISILPSSFESVSLSLPILPLSKTPKQFFFNPINLIHYYKIHFFSLGPFTGKGVSSQGFKYQVPYSNVHPMAPYSGNPFTAAYGPGGPYYQQGAGDASTTTQPTLQNYTQFGPHPFGKQSRIWKAL